MGKRSILLIIIVIFVALVVIGASVPSEDADEIEIAQPVEKEGAAEEETIYTFQNPTEFQQGTAEYVLAEFALAWKEQDWSRMTNFVQTTWLSRQDDAEGLLEAQYGFKTLKGFEVINVGDVETLASVVDITYVDITFTVKYEFVPNRIDEKQITARVIKEDNKWGVNPISTLREEDV